MSEHKRKSISILGIRGVPAEHGGFETFAQGLAPYLVSKGWKVTVYCQLEGTKPTYSDSWLGVERICISVTGKGALSTFKFDWLSSSHAAINEQGIVFTLGYNTAIFSLKYLFKKTLHVINMDGIEWQRQKWSKSQRLWFYMNELAGCMTGTILVADHPQIKAHLTKRYSKTPIVTIPYGAETIEKKPSKNYLAKYSLTHVDFATLIARPEPENSILEIVRAFSQKQRGVKLVVLGNFDQRVKYQDEVLVAASDEVIFLGAIYDSETVQELRANSIFYIHGHQVGGTNPSLVEALGAANPVIAHENVFNRYVAGSEALYFHGEAECAKCIDLVLSCRDTLKRMSEASLDIHLTRYTLPLIHLHYERLFMSLLEGVHPSDEELISLTQPEGEELKGSRKSDQARS